MIKTILPILLLSFVISCQDKSVDDFERIASLDINLAPPKAGEWLAEHPEKGQTFEEYVKVKPITASADRNTIFIQPIGDFNQQERKIVRYTVEYIALFFGIETIQLPAIQEAEIPSVHKRFKDGMEQLDASYINDSILPQRAPHNGLVIMAITAKDLYPDPAWNYVFGLANYSRGTGVSSIYRYSPNVGDYTVCLSRIIKTSAHEIGHMFKMKHCTHAVCLMNGANSLSEDDTKPNALCSVCLKKISWNLKCNNETRFQKLISFMEKHRLQKDAAILKSQYQLIQKK